MDNHSKEIRSYNMSRIRSKNSNPEIIVRKYLFRNGFRYRLHDKKLPGTPDIVLTKYKTVIFINGCFWHMHDCSNFVWPKSNQDYWQEKLNNNKRREKDNISKLIQLGWKVLIVWECELKKEKAEEKLSNLLYEIASF